jgi:membrane protein required for beta-lactamase induction
VGKSELEGALSALDVWLIIFGIFVAIGVVGESVSGFLHWRRSGQLQVLQTSENLAQQREIARLSAEGETAKSAIARANESAANAMERAAEA